MPCVVRARAGIQNGAYANLRRGLFPAKVSEINDIIARGLTKEVITQAQVDSWNELSLKEKKAFVLTEEFGAYKNAFTNESFVGETDVANSKSRRLLQQKTVDASAPSSPETAIGPDLDSIESRPDVDLRPGAPETDFQRENREAVEREEREFQREDRRERRARRNAPLQTLTTNIEEGVLTPDQIERLSSHIDDLRDNLRRKDFTFSEILTEVRGRGRGRDGFHIHFTVKKDGANNLINISRTVYPGRELEHSLFQITNRVQGKGVAKDFLRFSLDISDTFKIPKISLQAALQNGAYTWLRYGWYPTSDDDLFFIFRGAVGRGKLTTKQFEFWQSLSSKEQRAFVLTDEFRAYKEALLGRSWDGSIDLTDPKARAILEGRITEARPPITDYTIDFSFADNQNQDIDFINQWRQSVSAFASRTNTQGASFDNVLASLIEEEPGIWRATISITDKDGATRISDIDITINQNDGSLRYNRFEINGNNNKGRIVSDDVIRVGQTLVEAFKLKTISLRAGGETGAYSWLRHGVLPESFDSIDRLILPQMGKLLTPQQVNAWFSLDGDAQKRAFVLSDDFIPFKAVLLDASWDGIANVESKVIRDALSSDVKSAPPTPKERKELRGTIIEAAEDTIAEGKIDRQVAKNKRNRQPRRTAPAFAQLADRYLAYGVDLNGVSENTVAKALEVYGRIELELVEALRNESPGDATRATVRAKRTRVLLKQAQVILTNGVETIRNFTLTDLHRIAIFEQAFNVSTINAVIGVEVAASSLTPTELSVIISDTLIQGAPSKEWWSRQTRRTTEAFSDSIRVGLLQGETTEQIVSRVQGSFTGRRVPYRTQAGALRFKSEYSGGILQTTRRQTTALVRTSVQTVSQAVRERVLDDNPDVVNGVQFLSTLDARTTPICQLHSLLVWDRNRNPVGHGQGFPGAPPLHYQCRSTLLPSLVPWSELSGASKKSIGEKIDKKERLRKTTQASANGQVPADLNYEGWLKTQSLSKQQNILGTKRYRLWKDGSINISAPRELR